MGKKTRLKKQIIANVKWLLKESDAGCITLGCAVLDSSLASLHRKFISLNTADKMGKGSSEKFIDDLITGYAPLANFSARIKLAFAYGLIVEADYKCLEVVRELRNEAAHVPFQYHLDDEGLKPLLDKVLEHEKIKELFD